MFFSKKITYCFLVAGLLIFLLQIDIAAQTKENIKNKANSTKISKQTNPKINKKQATSKLQKEAVPMKKKARTLQKKDFSLKKERMKSVSAGQARTAKYTKEKALQVKSGVAKTASDLGMSKLRGAVNPKLEHPTYKETQKELANTQKVYGDALKQLSEYKQKIAFAKAKLRQIKVENPNADVTKKEENIKLAQEKIMELQTILDNCKKNIEEGRKNMYKAIK